ncbi:unnamed protein product [Prorocentrum cordatum]|uniref:Protein kinase domain-containing protein n=1 Tax=Prorocentrum cordatum TaxID=2364126 RepID=A0ABN9VVR7_9DINO|nr:unnamed protein product [Polarella glacialis]
MSHAKAIRRESSAELPGRRCVCRARAPSVRGRRVTDFGFAKMSVSRWRGSSPVATAALPESAIPAVDHMPSQGSKASRLDVPAQSRASSRRPSRRQGDQSVDFCAMCSGSGQSAESPNARRVGFDFGEMSDQVGPATTESSSIYIRPGSTLKSVMTVGVGTLQWMAPEIMSGSTDYTAKVDVYAFGMLLFEIMCREPPFVDFEKGELQALVTKGVRPEVPPEVPRFYIRMSESCWDSDPEMRPDFGSLILDLQEYGQLKFRLTR